MPQPLQHLNDSQCQKLTKLLTELFDQHAAEKIVPPLEAAAGYWFGGGNMLADERGVLWLIGRYRNAGDSRTGLAAGERGLKCALFRSDDNGQSFSPVTEWTKDDLSQASGCEVLSIEGTALGQDQNGECLAFISTEKAVDYPPEVADFQKPGTGVWSVDMIQGPSPAKLDLNTFTPALRDTPPAGHLHVKDPVLPCFNRGQDILVLCTHPFCWSSTNTACAVRTADGNGYRVCDWEMVSRGPCWDVAATRITTRMSVPALGEFADLPPLSLYLYDGAECLRPLDANPQAVTRPRGYSCEEIGGAFVGWDIGFPQMQRLSCTSPLFTSPRGTGCSRYAKVLTTDEGIIATWQQSQEDGSQPLVRHFLPMENIDSLLR